MIENFLTMPKTSSFALAGVLILILFALYIRKIKFTTKMLINISLMLAMATILQYLRIYHFPQGGAVTLGSMIPLILISVRYGAGVGILTGFIFGFVNLIQDPFILHPIQVLFDYPLPLMAIGLSGIFPRKIFLGVIIAFCGRFICHFISGVIFFAAYAPPEMSPIIYSLIANSSYIVPELVISLLILKILPLKRLIEGMN